jgi:diketogulonate reductase-like aldo/keto reductase
MGDITSTRQVRMGRAIADRRERVFLMMKVCMDATRRSRRGLQDSLKRLKTDYLDL